MNQRSFRFELDAAAAVFFLVAAGLVFVPVVPWVEFYQEQRIDGDEVTLLVSRFGGQVAWSAVVGGGLASVAAVLVFVKKPLAGFWVAVASFFSVLLTYAVLHTTLTAEIASERKQFLVPGWGLSTCLLWLGVGLFVFFIHRWGGAIWVGMQRGLAPVERRLTPDEVEAPSRATWMLAVGLLALVVILLVSADPDDKVWKRMFR